MTDAEKFAELLVVCGKDLTIGLSALNDVQRFVSSPVRGAIFNDGEEVDTEQFRNYALAMIIEIAEFVQTFHWKPWKPEEKLKLRESPERTADEFADILAFMGILIHYLDRCGISPSFLAASYITKSLENIRRLHR